MSLGASVESAFATMQRAILHTKRNNAIKPMLAKHVKIKGSCSMRSRGKKSITIAIARESLLNMIGTHSKRLSEGCVRRYKYGLRARR